MVLGSVNLRNVWDNLGIFVLDKLTAIYELHANISSIYVPEK